MLLRALFVVFVVLALLGDARICLYVLNREVFGGHQEEKPPWNRILATAPLLTFLTLLFWPLNRWLDRLMSTSVVERVTPQRFEEVPWSEDLAKVGLVWLMAAACVGLLWIVERIHVRWTEETPLGGIRSADPELVTLRRSHIPFASLRKLGAHNDIFDLEVSRHEVFIDDLPDAFDGYRIAFLTDTHVVPFMRKLYEECVRRVSLFEPDLVLFGGDFVTFRRYIPMAAEVLTAGLTPRDGMYAVLGNHDYWSNAERVVEAFHARGVEFLTNRSVELRRNGAVLRLLGIDELYRGRPDVAAAFAGADPSEPCLGLTHHPDMIDRLQGRRLDLLLCGHTHGGQIRFPFFGAIVVPSVHEARFAEGFHRVNNVLMYVSRGIGAIPPLRILCRPEVATFTLRKSMRTT